MTPNTLSTSEALPREDRRHGVLLRLALLASLLGLVALGACRTSDIFIGGEDPDDFCDNVFTEPLMNLNEVLDEETGERVETVLLDSIRIGEVWVRNYNVLISPDSAYGVSASLDNLICDVPCGFGIFEGEWRFRISASGYISRVIELGEIRYTNITEGCPLRHNGGHHFETTLRPEN